uniref:Si:ch211-141o9.10 n=1 Tax=Lepisosteus oculatus TaxID=7918 RepID=W5N155_LEPOC
QEGAKKRVARAQGGREKKFIGAHVSIAGGIWKAVEECVSLGGRSFAMFLGSQRSWQRPPLDEKAAARFREACREHGVEPAFILPHGSYLMNCGSPKQGSTVGGQFSELRGIIERVRDKSRVGVCLDTCHAFAAGYDISAAGGIKKVLDEFDSVVGLSYLRALHLNDSKGE